ncbi:MAG: GspE/PulE family protein [Phycisphaerales bacterium]|jgi:general secretion pathway protein E|nr:GspE/PulE family protein [Phycisphaerales bacterium]
MPDASDTARPVAPLDPDHAVASALFLDRIDHEFARRHLVLGVEVGRNDVGSDEPDERPSERAGPIADSPRIVLLTSDRTPALIVFNIGVALGMGADVRIGQPLPTHVVPSDRLAAAIDRAYAHRNARVDRSSDAPAIAIQGNEGSGDVARDLDAALREAEGDLLSTHGKAPVVRLVDLLLFEALRRSASDVHVQPVRDRTLVRYRLDGTLHTVRELPAQLASSVVSRVKVMAGLDIAERRAPQDGRAAVSVGGSGRRVDLRVSTLPSTYGERLVIRVLDPASAPHLSSFGALGMAEDMQRRYLAQCARTSGIVLSTGPTGSGKTTTLYATLAWVSASNAGGTVRGCELNMMTIEDPVEYDLSGAGLAVSQTQVDPKKNVTFAAGLRHILRQDPDVIMVGEVRDHETAKIAVQASLTGHLVLSTLHTIDSASAVTRLLDLGVEPFLVSSSLSAALAQRLVRRVHAPCRGQGCPECLGTGYMGRTGVFELLVMDEAVRRHVVQREPATVIARAARDRGMRTLREAGEELVARGVTSMEEIARVIDAGDEP